MSYLNCLNLFGFVHVLQYMAKSMWKPNFHNMMRGCWTKFFRSKGLTWSWSTLYWYSSLFSPGKSFPSYLRMWLWDLSIQPNSIRGVGHWCWTKGLVYSLYFNSSQAYSAVCRYPSSFLQTRQTMGLCTSFCAEICFLPICSKKGKW